MKKFKRILFCIALTCFLFFGCYLLQEEFTKYNLTTKIKEDATLLIPIHLTFFSLLSLLYNINKLQKSLVLNSLIYKVLKVGDFIFSISISIFSLFCVYILLESSGTTEIKLNHQLILWSVLLVFFFAAFYFFLIIYCFIKNKKIF